MTDTELQQRIDAGRRVVEEQIEFFNTHFGRVVSDWKGDATRVTPVDLAVGRNIFRDLAAAFPEDDLFGEEMSGEGGPFPRKKRFSWVLDPVDGTNNYALGVPFCAISLGLLRDGLPVYGFVYDFARGKLITGGPGFGVRDGEDLARVRTASPTQESLVAVQSRTTPQEAPRVAPLLGEFKIRAMGSSTLHLAYVAIGLFDGSVDLNVRVWDIAAAYALCLGSGVQVRFLNGEVFPLETFDLDMPRLHYCAGNPLVCQHLERLLGERETPAAP